MYHYRVRFIYTIDPYQSIALIQNLLTKMQLIFYRSLNVHQSLLDGRIILLLLILVVVRILNRLLTRLLTVDVSEAIMDKLG